MLHNIHSIFKKSGSEVRLPGFKSRLYLPLASYETFGKLLNFFVLKVLYVKSKDNSSSLRVWGCGEN